MRIAVLDSGQKIINSNLVLNVDAGQLRSYSGSGTTWTDLSGNGYNGTLTNGPTFDSANGGSIIFDGTNDFVNVTATNTIVGDNLAQITLEAWSKHTGTANIRMMNLARDTVAQSWCFLNANAGSVGAIGVSRWTGSTLENVLATGTYNDGTWRHIVGTLSTTTGGKLYINGQLAASSVTNLVSVSGNTGLTKIGSATGSSNFWNGNIAIARIYTKVLSDDEVLQNYNAIKSRFGL
jgi:hypothetical protein